MSDEQKLEEQVLSKVVETQLSNQLDKAEKIDVDVQTDLLKTVQGQADSVTVEGQGLVMQKDIRVQEIKLQTDSISVNPLSAILGQIELNQPVNTAARIVLLEDDINRALTSDFVRSKLQKYDLNVDGQIVGFEAQQIQIFLPDQGKIGFRGRVLLHEPENTRQLSFTAMVSSAHTFPTHQNGKFQLYRRRGNFTRNNCGIDAESERISKLTIF